MAGRVFWGVLATVALLGAGAVWRFSDGGWPTGPAGAGGAPAPAPAARTIAVEATAVTVGVVTEDIRAVGSLQPNESVVVAPEIAGRIAAIRFREGERVASGAVLVELDSGILRAELAKARSDLTLAQANHQRAITLANQGIGTLRARDEAVAALQVEQANVALAEARLEKTVVTSPFDGLAGLRAVSVGAFVTPGARIVEIADIDPIKVDFRVPELALPALRPGQTVRIDVDALPGRAFEGTVYAIDPVVDPNGRAVRLRARVPNPDGALSPGLFARVRIEVGRRDAAVQVPETAVFVQDGRTFVYRLTEDRAALTEVTLGQRLPGLAEVVDGLAAGDVVVTAGHQQLRDGLRVEVVRPRAGT